METTGITTELRSNGPENFKVIRPTEFLDDFRKEVSTAKDRVWVRVMLMEQGVVIGSITHVMRQAAERGIDVRLLVDNFSLMKPAKDPYGAKVQQRFNEEMFRGLEEAGVKVGFTNPPGRVGKFVPFIGRSHEKIKIVDNTAWMGGLNFGEDNFRSGDFEVKITKPEIVEALAGEFLRTTKERSREDYEVPCDEESSLLVDIGKRGRSLILERAIDLVNHAESVVENLRYFIPGGRFLDALQAARNRGVKVDVVVADPQRITDRPFQILDKALGVVMKVKSIKGKVPVSYYPGWLHAKLLVVDGRTVLFGSHNLSPVDVMAGTSEMDLLSRNTTLVNNLEDFFQSIRQESQR